MRRGFLFTNGPCAKGEGPAPQAVSHLGGWPTSLFPAYGTPMTALAQLCGTNSFQPRSSPPSSTQSCPNSQTSAHQLAEPR
eukprot:scaffold106457_cov28-Tisochrysis_lutea.AAC.4